MSTERRYDIDWLRVIAIGLLIIYHISIIFQPWGVFIGFMQSEKSMESLWIPMSMLNVWRIPLLFFVSGMGVCFAMRKRNFKELILERTKRILIPFIFGVFAIVPIHIFVWQKYYYQDIKYLPNPSHLWFLANIFIYVIVLAPLFFYLKKSEKGIVNLWLKKTYNNPLGLLIIILPFILEVILVKPDAFEVYAMTPHGFFLGLLAFFFGFTFILNGDTLWKTVLKWKWMYFLLATSLYLIRLLFFQLKSPVYLTPIESNLWVFALLGFAYAFLNKPSNILNYLKQGAYPIYILHMIFIYLSSLFILPLNINNGVKLLLIVVFTVFGCFITYDFFIRRIRFLRPLFGI